MNRALLESADAGGTILAPNTELAAALFDALERAYRDSGREIWRTPRVRDFGGWLRERHIERQFTDSSTPRCLTDVEEREVWHTVVLEREPGEPYLDPSGAVRAARRARRAMHEYAIPPRAIAADGGEESLMFLDWNARFEERCRAVRCIDADRLPMSMDCASPLAWIESPHWRPVARGWLQAQIGPALEPSEASPPAAADGLGASRLLGAGSRAEEFAAMSDWARQALLANPAFRAWICVPDLARCRSELVDAFDAALAPQRFSLDETSEAAPYAVAGGTPLAGYAPVRAALDLLAASAGPVSFTQFSALLRSPELQESGAEAGVASILDVALRSRAPSEIPLADWLQLAQATARAQSLGPVGALQRLQASARILGELGGQHPMSRWVRLWVAAFESAPWSLRRRWSSGEYQSAERFRELLAALAGGDPVFGTQSRAAAESILRRAARDTAFQMQTGVPAVWVSGQLIDPWLTYDGLWVAGCCEARWPPPVDPVPLLPVRLQREHGVVAAGAEAQLQFAEDLQRRWRVRARSCVFSCADSGDGRHAAPSALLFSTAPGEPLMSAPQPHWLAQLNHAPELEALADERAPRFAADERTRGVSTLRAQSRCAFRGFAETRLMTETLERPVPGFNERERGEILHHALERIWSELRDSRRLAALGGQQRAELLDHSARSAVAASCRRRDPGARWRERERIRLNGVLSRWLQIEAERSPFEVESLEGGSQRASFGGVEFSVRIDRVDRLEDGARVLIDYKSGSPVADWRGDRPDNPQLPIYALLLPQALVAVAYGSVNASECSFVAEAERRGIFKRTSQRTGMEGMDSLEALMRVWLQRIENLAAAFAAGRAEVDPTPKACESCRLHGLCRVH
ncbi:MAG: PD-(D/E)XK nuclease family protein [Steroidobacteraceae bacterium]